MPLTLGLTLERTWCARLDKFLFRTSCEEWVGPCWQEALVRVVSDHCPIILDSNKFRWGPTPSLRMWLKHQGFKKLFRESWVEGGEQGWEGFKLVKKLERIKN